VPPDVGEVRQRDGFHVFGYVVIPEHVHLMVNQPECGGPSIAVPVLKQRSAHKILNSHPSNGEKGR
jgi:REP element-mobilizing transposase RayT